MKRQQREKSIPAGNKTRVIDAVRLTGVRGGDGIGVVVQTGNSNPDFMSMQHNERFVPVDVPEPTPSIWQFQHNERFIQL